MLVLVSQGAGEKDVSLDVFWKWLRLSCSNWDREVIPPAGHSPGKGPWEWFGTLFGMAPQDVVHLQNASFWRAHKFELASLGILGSASCGLVGKHQYLEFDASGYW